jgi:hypothetical protein
MSVYDLLQEQGESVEFKASFYFNEMEGDIIGFETINNIYEDSQFRVVESGEQLRNVYALLFQNLSQIEAQCDLKNAFEMCHIVLSFKVKESEINFVCFPVFSKNFKLSEPYSTWVQFKSILKSGDGRVQGSSSIASFFKQSLPGTRLCFLLFVESGADKYQQSSTVLEETARLMIDLKTGGAASAANIGASYQPTSAMARQQSDSMHNSRNLASDHSSQANDEQDQYSKQVIQEVNDFILRSEELFVRYEIMQDNQSNQIDNPQYISEETKRQIELYEQKIEIANDSTKSPIIKQRLLRCQKRLNDLRDTIENTLLAAKRNNSMRTGSQQFTKNRIVDQERYTSTTSMFLRLETQAQMTLTLPSDISITLQDPFLSRRRNLQSVISLLQ